MSQQTLCPKIILLALLILSGCTESPPASKATPEQATESVQRIYQELEKKNRSARNEAMKALSGLGTPAIPALIEGLKHWNPQVRLASIGGLAMIGPEAAEAIPLLAKMADDSDHTVRLVAISSLSNFGPKAIPDLVKLLKDRTKDTNHRYNAAAALGRIGEPALPALLQMLKGADRESRIDATVALGVMGPAARAAIPALSEAAEHDRDGFVRRGALNALQKIRSGPKPDSPAPTQTSKGKAKKPSARQAPQRRAPLPGPAAPDVVPSLIEALKDKDKTLDERQRAIQRIYRAGLSAATAIPVLIEIAQDEYEPVRLRSSAIRTLGHMGLPAKRAVPALLRLIEHKEYSIRTLAMHSLARIAPSDPDVLAAFIRRLKDQHSRDSAILALGKMGEAAVPALIEALQAPDPETRVGATRALGRIGPPAKDAAKDLIRLVEDPKWGVRMSAIWALGRIGTDEAAALTALKKALGDEDFRIRRQAVIALGSFGESAASALREKLTDRTEGPEVRRSAARALKKIEAGGKESVPAFIRALDDIDPAVRLEAMTALGHIGADARPAIPKLLKALEDPKMHNTAIAAVMGIVHGLVRSGRDEAMQEVYRMRDYFAGHNDPKIRQYAMAVSQMMRDVQNRIW